jgi:hypothetical protein
MLLILAFCSVPSLIFVDSFCFLGQTKEHSFNTQLNDELLPIDDTDVKDFEEALTDKQKAIRSRKLLSDCFPTLVPFLIYQF